MRIVAALLLPVVLLLTLGCTPAKLSPPPLGVGRLDPPPQNSSQIDEATAKFFTPIDGMAVVYIYRPRKFVGFGVTTSIVINDKFIAFIGNGSFLRIVLPRGKYAIRTGTHYDFKDREIDVEPGQVYFFGAKVDFANPISVVFPVSPDDAKGEILKLKMTDNPYNF